MVPIQLGVKQSRPRVRNYLFFHFRSLKNTYWEHTFFCISFSLFFFLFFLFFLCFFRSFCSIPFLLSFISISSCSFFIFFSRSFAYVFFNLSYFSPSSFNFQRPSLLVIHTFHFFFHLVLRSCVTAPLLPPLHLHFFVSFSLLGHFLLICPLFLHVLHFGFRSLNITLSFLPPSFSKISSSTLSSSFPSSNLYTITPKEQGFSLRYTKDSVTLNIF